MTAAPAGTSAVATAAALPKNARRVPVPAAAVGEWLAEIEDPDEIKVTLRAVGIVSGRASRKGVPASAGLDELLDDRFLLQGVASGPAGIVKALGAALRRGTLAAARYQGDICVYLNDDAARRHFCQAKLTPLTASDVAGGAEVGSAAADYPPSDAAPPSRRRANIAALYEQHISNSYGHSIAEQLRAAEEEYPAQWIERAFAAAAERDARSWSYVIAILRRWMREGPPKWAVDTHDNGESGNDTAADGRTGYLESYRRRYGRLPWESGEDGGASGG